MTRRERERLKTAIKILWEDDGDFHAAMLTLHDLAGIDTELLKRLVRDPHKKVSFFDLIRGSDD